MTEIPISERQQVVAVIVLAWDDVQYPGDDKIINSLPRDDAGELYRSFVGKHWRDISLETLIANRDNLYFFTPEAFIFYLPVFMSAVIQHYESVDVLSNNTIYSISPPSNPLSTKRLEERTSKFTVQQKHAIGLFLETCAKLEYCHFEFDSWASRGLVYWSNKAGT